MTSLSSPERHRTGRWTGRVLIAAAALLPLSVLAQSPQSTSWADEIIKKEGYVTPPKEVADAVLAPRHLNVNLSNLGPAKDYFLDTVSDGPVAIPARYGSFRSPDPTPNTKTPPTTWESAPMTE